MRGYGKLTRQPRGGRDFQPSVPGTDLLGQRCISMSLLDGLLGWEELPRLLRNGSVALEATTLLMALATYMMLDENVTSLIE